MIRRLIAATAAFSALGGVLLVQSGGAAVQDHGSATITCGENLDGTPDGTLSWAPTTLFPPNHKPRTIPVTYTDSDGGQVSLTVTVNPHNEIVDGEEINGTGKRGLVDSMGGSAQEEDGSATVNAWARAERSGHKNAVGGRVYEFDYDATSMSGDGGCSSDTAEAGDGILICVPHDMRDGGRCDIEQQPSTPKPAPPDASDLEGLAAPPEGAPAVQQSVEQIVSGLQAGLLGG